MTRQNDGRLEIVGVISPIDIYIGLRIQDRRNLCSLSKEALAEALDVTFQQVENYENGTSRVGASRLFDISQLLKMPISYFFDGMPTGIPINSDVHPSAWAPNSAEWPELLGVLQGDKFREQEALELVRAYFRISDQVIRHRMIDLVKSLSSEEVTPDKGKIAIENKYSSFASLRGSKRLR